MRLKDSRLKCLMLNPFFIMLCREERMYSSSIKLLSLIYEAYLTSKDPSSPSFPRFRLKPINDPFFLHSIDY